MSLVYLSRSGYLYGNGKLIGRGYSGHAAGLNNPDLQYVPRTGPIPVGLYKIGKGASHPRLGPFAIPLSPLPGTEMHGRSGIFIHGDNAKSDKSASLGCIVLPKSLRAFVASFFAGETLTVIPM